MTGGKCDHPWMETFGSAVLVIVVFAFWPVLIATGWIYSEWVWIGSLVVTMALIVGIPILAFWDTVRKS